MKKRRTRYTEEQVRARLDGAIERAGSQAAFADAHGISRQYLSDVIHRRRELAGKILDALGLERIIEYQEKRSVKGR